MSKTRPVARYEAISQWLEWHKNGGNKKSVEEGARLMKKWKKEEQNDEKK